MDIPQSVHWAGTLAPVALMATAAAASLLPQRSDAGRWRLFQAFSVGALVLVVLTLVSGAGRAHWGGAFAASTLSLSLAALVQLLGTVIGAFSAQYLQGEPGQRRYVAALAAVLAQAERRSFLALDDAHHFQGLQVEEHGVDAVVVGKDSGGQFFRCLGKCVARQGSQLVDSCLFTRIKQANIHGVQFVWEKQLEDETVDELLEARIASRQNNGNDNFHYCRLPTARRRNN